MSTPKEKKKALLKSTRKATQKKKSRKKIIKKKKRARPHSLLAEYYKKWSLFVIWALFKLIWENNERSKFQQLCCQNSKKKYEKWERNDVMEGERDNWILVM